MNRLDAFKEIAEKVAAMDQLSYDILKIWNTYIEHDDAMIFFYPISEELQNMDFEAEWQKAMAEGYRTSPNQHVLYVQVICGAKTESALDIIPEFFSHEVIAKAVGVKPSFLTDDQMERDQDLYDAYIDAVLGLYHKIESELEWNKFNRIVHEDYEGPTGDYTDEFVVVCPSLVIDRVSKEILSR